MLSTSDVEGMEKVGHMEKNQVWKKLGMEKVGYILTCQINVHGGISVHGGTFSKF